MLGYKGIQLKLYPNVHQKHIINMTLGHTRFVWNQMLDMLNTRYANNSDLNMLSFTELSTLLTQLKKEYVWLKDVDSVAVQCSVKTLRETFDSFFKRMSGYPKFKSGKIAEQSYSSTIRKSNGLGNIRLNKQQSYIKIPKLGWVKCRVSSDIDNNPIKSITVKRLSTGNYVASVLVECENQTFEKTGKVVGLDMGLNHFAITSDGDKIATQKLYLKYKEQLYYWEKRLARRRLLAQAKGVDLKDAKNYQKARKQVARIHKKISNTRKDYLHKESTKLVKKYDKIMVEDLRTSNMIKNHKLARSISNQGWRLFRTLLEYKCEKYGKELIAVNPYKTTQVCSTCKCDNGKKGFGIDYWTCKSCKTHHDRDINAAINIKNIGLGQALVNS